MIELVDIYKSYQIDSTSFPVLKKINLMINPGEFVGIMGKSGSGKSTLINLIGLIDKKFEGLYRFNGESIASYSDNQLSQIRNEQVGFVFQNFSLIESKTVRENVELPLLYQGISHRNTKERVEAALEKVGLTDKLNVRPKHLSGGQQQRVAIARAIINQPSFIIADEPTGALDSKTSLEIMELFKQLNQDGVTIILVTHDVAMASYCSRVLHVLDGEIIDEVEEL